MNVHINSKHFTKHEASYINNSSVKWPGRIGTVLLQEQGEHHHLQGAQHIKGTSDVTG